MFQQIDLNAVATFVLDVCDYSPGYEDDSFVVEVEGARFYVERKCNWFILHVGQLKHRLPR